MAVPSDEFQREKAFFHSQSKVQTEDSQFVFESQYKSAHTVDSNSVIIEDLVVASTKTQIDSWISSNPGILKKFDKISLTEISGSNGQAWFIDDPDITGGKFVRPWISPVDVPDPTTNLPSDGYLADLFESDDTLIPPTNGVFIIDYFSGMVIFEEGFTPTDQGYGIPKITVYAYIGKTLSDIDAVSGNIIASDVFTNETGLSVQDKIDELNVHINDFNNPHKVLSTQVSTTSTGQSVQDILNDLQNQINNVNTDDQTASEVSTNDTGQSVQNKIDTFELHIGNTLNPHSVFAEQIPFNNSFTGSPITSTTVQGAIEEIIGLDQDNQTASQVPYDPNFSTGNTLTSTNVQGAIDELEGKFNSISDTDNQNASEVPTKNTGENVQDVLDDYISHKNNSNNPHQVISTQINTTTTGENVQEAIDSLKNNSINVNNWIIEELHTIGTTGTIVTVNNEYIQSTLKVFKNGIRQIKNNDYLIATGNDIEFIDTLEIGDTVIFDYLKV